MLKVINLFLWFLFFINFTFAISFTHFDIKLDKPYQKGHIFSVTPKNIDWKIVNMSFFINNEKFPRLSSDDKKYLFKIPSDLLPWDKKLKIEVNFADKTKKDYSYNLPVPYFKSIDTTNLTWWWTFEIYGTFTWSCNLHLWDLSLWISSKDWKYYFHMPDNVKNPINTAYVVCNDIASNIKSIDIKASPVIFYSISEDKKNLKPWDSLIIVWNYIKFKNTDDLKVLIDWKQVPYNLLNNNKVKFYLPYKNLSTANLQIVRNWFKSNIIKLSNIIKYPKIYQVNIINKDNKSFFRLYWDFDFKLGWLGVTYAWRTMSVINTWNLNDIEYIDVDYPYWQIDNNWNINCSYELYPSYFHVNLWTQKSNWFFYEPDNLIKITKIGSPSCANNFCNLDLFLNKNPWKINVLLNWSKIGISTIGNQISLSLWSNFIKKWKVEILNQSCIKTQPYYFDFSNEFIPLIREVSSKDNFIPSWYFTIHGEKLTHDGYHTGMKVNLSFSPDIVDKKTLVYDWNTVEGEILSNAKNWTKVKIDLSNLNWKSNWAYFVVWWANKYIANPYIKSVIYENGAWVGDKIEINWINFSYPNCSKDLIYIWDKIVYPDSCDYNKLIFTVPDDVNWNTIKVLVDDNSSNIYKLNSSIWWKKIFKKFDIIPEVSTKQIDLSKSNKVELNLKIHNPSTDIYLSSLLFKLDFGNDYLPAWDFILSVNWNNKRYYFNSVNNKITKTDLLNNWKILKKWKSYFIEFDDIYVPYSSQEISLTLDFNVSKSITGDSVFNLALPKQTIYYQNIYKANKFERFNLLDKKLTTVYILNKHSICFDSDSTFKNCALVLRWKDISKQNVAKINNIKNTLSKSDTKQVKSTDEKIEKKNITNKQVRHENKVKHTTISRQEQIAQRLNIQKIQIINKVIKNYIIKLKKKYWGTKKIYYVLEMYKWYKKMEANVSDDFNKKLNYVDWLISFAKAYFSYIKNK